MTRLAMVTALNRPAPYLAAYDDNVETWRDIPHGAFCVNSPTSCRPVVVIDPEDREQVERLARDFLDKWSGCDGAITGGMQDALRSLIAPPKCAAILNVKGEHVDCDRGEGHSLPHGNVEHGAIWQGVTS